MQAVLSDQSYRGLEKCSDHTLFNVVNLSGFLCLPASLFKGLAHLPKANVFKASFPLINRLTRDRLNYLSGL